MAVYSPAILLGIDDGVQQSHLARQLGGRRGKAHPGEDASGLAVLSGEQPGTAATGLGQGFLYFGYILGPGLGGQVASEFRPDKGQRRSSSQKFFQLGPVAVPLRGLEVYTA